jgi:hypothetical protein
MDRVPTVADDIESSASSSSASASTAAPDEFNQSVITPSESFRRLAVRRRHSLQQKDEEASCRSTMAATGEADEALFEPSSKFAKQAKPDSPGEAW